MRGEFYFILDNYAQSTKSAPSLQFGTLPKLNALRSSALGFTLVELAIVMTIIGLLIGGILKGQELMQNARMTANIAQVRSIQAAVYQFRDAYSQYPGDFARALTQLPNCNAATLCLDGDGNTLLEIPAPTPWDDFTADISSENTQFWKHLALADMISGVNPAGGPAPVWGETHPPSKLWAGFHAISSMGGWCYEGFCVMSGLMLLNRNSADGSRPIGFIGIRPKIAAQIDRKMDDGQAGRGDVQAISEWWVEGCGPANLGPQGPSGYAEGISKDSCELMFKL